MLSLSTHRELQEKLHQMSCSCCGGSGHYICLVSGVEQGFYYSIRNSKIILEFILSDSICLCKHEDPLKEVSCTCFLADFNNDINKYLESHVEKIEINGRQLFDLISKTKSEQTCLF